jgi:uncharacterized protein YfdQ (DUF2303 family)
MEAKAIELIQATAVKANGDPLPAWIREQVAVLPSGYGMHNLEAFHPERFRFRGAMTTTDIDSFVSYVNKRGAGDAFIDPQAFTATVFFNLGGPSNPGHADWTAKLALQQTAAYQAMISANGDTFDQRELVDFFEDWAPIVSAWRTVPAAPGDLDGAGETETISVPKLISAIRRIKIKAGSETKTEVQQYAASQSSLEQISAESDDGLPDVIRFRCAPYHGLPERDFDLRLSILTSGREPALKLRIVSMEAAKEAMLDDFESLLRSQLAEAVQTVIGTFKP